MTTVQARRRPNWTYRQRGLSSHLRVGHCAPTAMRAILDPTAPGGQAPLGVDFSAGMTVDPYASSCASSSPLIR